MGRLSRAEQRAMSDRITAALEAGRVRDSQWRAYDINVKRAAFKQLGAHHILKLARQLGVKAPKDPDARERFNYGDAVKKALGI